MILDQLSSRSRFQETYIEPEAFCGRGNKNRPRLMLQSQLCPDFYEPFELPAVFLYLKYQFAAEVDFRGTGVLGVRVLFLLAKVSDLSAL